VPLPILVLILSASAHSLKVSPVSSLFVVIAFSPR